MAFCATLVLSGALLLGPTVFAQGPADEPADASDVDVPLAGDPPIPALSAEEMTAVTALRVTVRRLKRCEWSSREGLVGGAPQCQRWIDEVQAAPAAVRRMAAGLEWLRDPIAPQPRHPLHEQSEYLSLWLSWLVGDGSAAVVPFLVRALTMNAAGVSDAVRELENITLIRFGRLPGSQDTAGIQAARASWLAWYRAHATESRESWRRQGLTEARDLAARAATPSEIADAMTTRLWRSMTATERREFCTVLTDSRLGRPARTRLETFCRRTGLSAREMLRMRRESEAAR